MKIYFVRHGETDWNARGHIQGSNDTDLNAAGREQAEELGKKLFKEKLEIAKIYTSPQKRAVQTAEIVANKLGLTYQITKGLEEMSLGVWEGHTWEEVRNQDTEYYQNWYKNRRYVKAPEGESYQELLVRNVGALLKIIEKHTEDVIVITHSAVIMTLRCWLNDTPFSEMIKRYRTGNATIVEIDAADIVQKELSEKMV